VQGKTNTTRRVSFAPNETILRIHTYPAQIRGRRKRRPRRTNKMKQTEIRLLYCNVNGIRSKMESIRTVTKTEQSDIILLTETKGEPPMLEGYRWYSKQRENGKGGGIAIAVTDELASITKETTPMENTELETLWIEIEAPKKERMYIGCFYGPQENANSEWVESQYAKLGEQVTVLKRKGKVILTGDFNAKLATRKGSHHQDLSRNGKFMEEFMEETEMTTINGMSNTGMWTRVNRRNPQERSVIDYILVNSDNRDSIKEVEIDEEGTKRLKNQTKESDHNTITATVKFERTKKKEKITKWCINAQTDWAEFNKVAEQLLKKRKNEYDGTIESLKKALEETVGKKTITVNGRSKKETQEVKNMRMAKKEKRREFEKAETNEKEEKLRQYYEAQANLREAINKQEKERVRQTIEEIARSRDPNTIWKVRKRLLGKGRDIPVTITEDDVTLENEEIAKEYIANFYEKLYQAREEEENGKEWTSLIDKENEKNCRTANNGPVVASISMKEMEQVKKKLKKRKSCGPDGIPNEVMIYASRQVTEKVRENMNHIAKKIDIPNAWRTGRIIRLYKGKGTKGKCSNERGITISSNMGKFFERIINERAKRMINISDMQGGGKKGSNTVDHILTLQEMIRKGKNVYIVFLDVTKAYDKAWADGIMYVLAKQGIQGNLWKIIQELNKKLTATIETKYGNTREIQMKDNIRQGGVLSVIMYAVLMDEIAKEIKRRNLGIAGEDGTNTGCLLWMDDVALIANNPEEMQEMLDITSEIGIKYRIKFGMEKSKVLKIGHKLPDRQFRLGDMNLEYCTKYKYLGIIMSNKNNQEEQLKEVRRKVEAAYNTILAIAGSVDLKGVEMKSIWEMVQSCLIPLITYGAEATTPTKKETEMRNGILQNILKRIIMTPKSTPCEPLYMETGLYNAESYIIRNKIQYMEKIKEGSNSMLTLIMESKDTRGWGHTTRETQKDLLGHNGELTGSKWKRRKTINEAVQKRIEGELLHTGQNKTKTKYYLENKEGLKIGSRAKYMDQCTRTEASIIFMARTRMMGVKGNYKNKYPNIKCRLCGNEDETQEHILEECTRMDRSKAPRVTTQEIFQEDVEKLKEVAKKLMKTKEFLTCVAPVADRG